jgi:hypothetical protein
MKQVEKQNTDIKELENHFKDIDDFYKEIKPRLYRYTSRLTVFDLNCDNVYRVFKESRKLLVFYKIKKDLPNDVVYGEQPYKFYDITEEQIKKLEKYYQ